MWVPPARLAAANVIPSKVEGLRRIVREHEVAVHRGDMRAISAELTAA